MLSQSDNYSMTQTIYWCKNATPFAQMKQFNSSKNEVALTYYRSYFLGKKKILNSTILCDTVIVKQKSIQIVKYKKIQQK